MSSVSKTLLAIGILAGGGSAALMFRRQPSRWDAGSVEPADRLVLRSYVGPSATEGLDSFASVPPARQSARPAIPALAASHDLSTDRDQPPSLARTYPQVSQATPIGRKSADRRMVAEDVAAVARLAAPLGFTQNAAIARGLSGIPNPEQPTTHVIVNGDTLESLADRYLGRADRAMEIFEANRYRLSHPRILPIGMELTIPPRQRPPVTGRQRLVPVSPADHHRAGYARDQRAAASRFPSSMRRPGGWDRRQ